MKQNYSDFQIRAMEKVKQLWHMYIVNPEPARLEHAFKTMPENLLMIGTGRHEFYKNLNEFLTGMSSDQIEARDIQFEFQDEWYDALKISDDICVVFGSIWVREKVMPGKAVLVDMEGSRFTIVCRDLGEQVEICSIHHSMPYLDQGETSITRNPWPHLQMKRLKRTKSWSAG
ncbi:nuclear transport factor 2 family protein [Massiliimalia massiliensis]|uniref:nuclear transport factor 2 family protein n=1 Tax=Massiliimalia massiliensis TaxID=1852384 RepID=UPI001E451A3F|nr:nuclear transport factor 2 family protein [Massiliimalia massiliensis]